MSKSKQSSKKKSVKKCVIKHVTKKNLPFIQALSKLTDDERHAVLKYINRDGREILYQCITNCIYNPIVPNKNKLEIKQALSAKSKVYKYLAKARNCVQKKKKLLQQRQTGQGLGLILHTVLPILAALFANK
jgi:hypothetical protein